MAWGIVVKLIIVTTILVFIGAALPSQAQAVITHYDLNIPREPLDRALKQFAEETGLQVARFSDVAQGSSQVGPLIGHFTTEEALSSLLAGSGLTYRILSHRTIAIVRPSGHDAVPAAGRSQEGKGKSSSSPGFRVAQVAQGAVTGADSVKSAKQQSASEESPLLQEIIVTAQKYSQRAFDVPISLDVLSGEDLQQDGITNLSDLQYAVPGLRMDDTGYTQGVYLRGVGNYEGSGAMVGQYIDEADITTEGVGYSYTGSDTGLYDLDRVEVLKGPQGTLYGDGSMGGVIRYITNKPVLDQFQGNVDVATMFTQYGAPSQRIETMLNTPLNDGTLGLRVAGLFEHDGGWVDEPVANLKNINDGNLTDVRAEALWQPTARLKVNAMQIIHRHSYGLDSGEDASGNFTPLFGTTLTPNASDNSDLSNLALTYDFDDVQLLNSATYLTEDEDLHNLFQSETIGSESIWSLFQGYNTGNKDASDELRLAHTGREPWQWTVGSFYKHFTFTAVGPPLIEGPSGSTLSSASTYPISPSGGSSIVSAGFANTSYEVERLTLGAGVRYSKDRETAFTIGAPFQEATFTSTDPRFFVQYQVSPNVNIYASASKGFRSGGLSADGAPPFQPESLWSYDLGSKFRFPDEGVRADVDLFDMNYSNFVSSAFNPIFFEIEANDGKARITGVDADVTWLPVEGWRFTANTEILDTKFLTTTSASGYVPGDRLPYAPIYSFKTSVEREFSLKNKPAYVELDYYEISRTQYRLANFPLSQSDILRFLNGRVGVHMSDNLQFAVFAHNLLNDRGLESVLSIIDQSTRSQPRTFGIEFTASLR
jgi:outer membrane receptor protein involved in Fe transport